MTDNAVMIKVNDFEQRLLVNGMNRFRNDLIREDLPTDDVDDVLLNTAGCAAGYLIFTLLKRRAAHRRRRRT